MSHSPYTEAQVKAMPLIVGFLNKNTNRWLSVHRHPSDTSKVIAMDYPVDHNGKAIKVIPRIAVVSRAFMEWFVSTLPDGC